MEYLNSVATGVADTARGVVGLETGEWKAVTLEFVSPVIGLAFNDEGYVTSIQPGGEAEQKCMQVGDRVVAVGGTAVDSDAAIKAAYGAHPDRPVVLKIERKPQKATPVPMGDDPHELD